jgi:hypothetical protein
MFAKRAFSQIVKAEYPKDLSKVAKQSQPIYE